MIRVQMARVAAIYARGLNPPYTEGHIGVADSFARAVAMSGWTALTLNYRYSSGLTSQLNSTYDDNSYRQFEVKVPGINREKVLNTRKFGSHSILASLFEFVLTPMLVAHELSAKASVAHLVNCFKLPRASLRLLSSVPVVVHIYQSSREKDLPRFFPPVDGMVASSRRIAKSLKNRSGRRSPIFMIPPAVNEKVFQSRRDYKSKDKKGLYIGHLSRNRFPDQMLSIFQDIVRIDPEVSFRLIAPAGQKNLARASEIERICKSMHIEDRVSVSVRDMSVVEKLREYSTSKCFFFAPLSETQEAIEPPLTVLEALGTGLPVVATDTYSVGEAVVSGKNGFVVSPRDYQDLVNKGVAVLQAYENEWRAWSNESRKVAVQSFSIAAVSEKVQKMHSAILGP